MASKTQGSLPASPSTPFQSFEHERSLSSSLPKEPNDIPQLPITIAFWQRQLEKAQNLSPNTSSFFSSEEEATIIQIYQKNVLASLRNLGISPSSTIPPDIQISSFLHQRNKNSLILFRAIYNRLLKEKKLKNHKHIKPLFESEGFFLFIKRISPRRCEEEVDSIKRWLPDNDSQLDNITELSLAKEGLEGPLPTQIGLLTHAERLDLSDNNITHLPKEIALLPKRCVIDIRKNSIQHGLSWAIPKFRDNLLCDKNALEKSPAYAALNSYRSNLLRPLIDKIATIVSKEVMEKAELETAKLNRKDSWTIFCKITKNPDISERKIRKAFIMYCKARNQLIIYKKIAEDLYPEYPDFSLPLNLPQDTSQAEHLEAIDNLTYDQLQSEASKTFLFLENNQELLGKIKHLDLSNQYLFHYLSKDSIPSSLITLNLENNDLLIPRGIVALNAPSYEEAFTVSLNGNIVPEDLLSKSYSSFPPFVRLAITSAYTNNYPNSPPLV